MFNDIYMEYFISLVHGIRAMNKKAGKLFPAKMYFARRVAALISFPP